MCGRFRRCHRDHGLRRRRFGHARRPAAVLREKADLAKFDRKDLGAWAPAIAELSGIEPKSPALVSYIHQNVYALISNGLVVTDLEGNVISEIKPKGGVVPNYPGADGQPVLAANPDYSGATWRASTNFSARPGGAVGKPTIVIIHTCEGAYSGCWGWLAKKESGVSAHYVVKEDGAEITQLVKEADKAWHIAAKYKNSLNGGKYAEFEGSSSNNFTIGIEHAGFANQNSWHANLIDQSARLVCDITNRNGIARESGQAMLGATRARFDAEGCWSCNQARDIRQEHAEFEAFMSMDEEARWREIWEKTRDRH